MLAGEPSILSSIEEGGLAGRIQKTIGAPRIFHGSAAWFFLQTKCW
jgi:hypothetical protein